MRKFLIVAAIMLLILYVFKFITYCILGHEFSSISFDVGFWTCIVVYVTGELLLHIKDRSKGGVVANVKITVSDVRNEEEVADALGNGLRVFNSFLKLGQSLSKEEEESPSEEDPSVEEDTVEDIEQVDSESVEQQTPESNVNLDNS